MSLSALWFSEIATFHLFEAGSAFFVAVLISAGALSCGLFIPSFHSRRPFLRALAGIPLFFLGGTSISVLLYICGVPLLWCATFFLGIALFFLVLALLLQRFQLLLRVRECVPLLLLFGAALVVMVFGLGEQGDGTIRAISGSWGDGVLHFLNAEAFRVQQGTLLPMPAYAGEYMREPFGFDFLASLLREFHFSLTGAFDIPAAWALASVWAWSGLCACQFLLRRFGRALSLREKYGTATLNAFLLLFGSGLQWIVMTWRTHAYTLSAFFGVHTPPWDKVEPLGLIWANHINIFASQKHFLFALSVLFILTALLLEYGEKRKRVFSLFLAIALTALLPLFHAHAFLAALLLWVGAWFVQRRVDIVLGAGMAFLAALPFFWWYHGAVARPGFIAFVPGFFEPPLVWFWPLLWFANLGCFLLLVCFGSTRKAYGPLRVLFGTAALGLFVLGNTFQLQPYRWDNHKVFLLAWILLLPLVASEVVIFSLRGRKKYSFARLLVAGLLVLSLTLTSLSEISTYIAFRASYPMFTAADRLRANEFAHILSENSIVLAATDVTHNHPVTLTGRTLVMGYGGWLWTRGLPWQERKASILRILQALSKEDFCQHLSVLHINDIVVGPLEHAQWTSASSLLVRDLLGLTGSIPPSETHVLHVSDVCADV